MLLLLFTLGDRVTFFSLFLFPTPLGTDQSRQGMDFSASLASSQKECAQPQLSGALASGVFNSWVSESQ